VDSRVAMLAYSAVVNAAWRAWPATGARTVAAAIFIGCAVSAYLAVSESERL